MLTTSTVDSGYDLRDYSITCSKELPQVYSCPVTVRVKNQGIQSTCVAHAAASVVEYHYKSAHKIYKSFSTEFIYGFRTFGYYIGDGMRIRDALKTLKNIGDCFKSDCSGNNSYKIAMSRVSSNVDKYKELAYPYRISAYYRCKTTEEIKTALIKHGPVLVSMNTYDGAKLVKDVYTYDSTAKYGRHCVMIYGYDERGWLVQNSWGSLWGGDGRFVLPYKYKLNEAWGISDSITDDINVKRTDSRRDRLYKLFNKVINVLLKFVKKS